MRYRVKAPDLAAYHSLLRLLTGRVPVLLASEKRRFLATEDLPDEIRQELEARGAEITPDLQYQLETS
jgi:hypothetical protein